jgi:Helix-turn-helix domain
MQTLLTQRDAATLLALSVRTLERLRVRGVGPRFVKAGKAVRYAPEALERWVAAQSRGSTSEQKEAGR